MSEDMRMIDLDPLAFEMVDYDNVRISLPAKPSLSEEDIDAQLFEYVLSSGKEIKSIADLDDTWVQSNFEGLNTIEDVRESLKAQYDHELEAELNDMKYAACVDAVIERLKGEVPEDILSHNVAVTRAANDKRLDEMHISLEQMLREEHLTIDQYEDRLREMTLRQMKLNVALDLMAKVLNTQVGNHELTEYLQTPDPEAFLKQIRENNQVEAARQAAVRVKTMRRVIDTAIVEEEGGEDSAPVSQPEPSEDDDIEVPDFDNLPKPQIKDDKADFSFTRIDPSLN